MTGRPADIPLVAYFSYFRRHIPIIAACMAVGVLVGFAIGHRVATYVGTAAVLAPPLDLGPHGVPGEATTPLREKDAVTPDTEAQIATSTPVLTAVRNATGLRANFADLSKRVTIDAPANTQVLAISFEARHPKAAKLGAQAAAEAFIAERSRLISDRQVADIGALDAQIDALRDDLAAATTRVSTSGDVGRTLGQLQQGAIIDKIRSLQRTQTRLATAQTDAGTILRPASESALRVRLGREVPVTTGLLLGLLAGLGLGQVRRRRFVSAWDLQRVVVDGGPVDVITVGSVVVPRRRQRRARGRLAFDIGLRRLRNATIAAGGGLSLLTGPARPTVTAALSAGFARALARTDEGVAMLVLTEDPAVLKSLGVSTSSLRDVENDPVATGQRAPEPGDIAAYRVGRSDPVAAAATLRRAYPHVVVVAPGATDATVCAVAQVADRVLVSAERRRTHVRDVVNVVRRLRIVGAPVTTSLLVKAAR
jgi:capsular polysaccharide biosynthesis protein